MVADIIDTVVGRTHLTFRNLKLWSDSHPPRQVTDSETTINKYYLRLQVKDEAGVMADTARILGSHGVSIASINQQETASGDPDNTVSLVIMSHATTAGAMQAAATELESSDNITGKAVIIRIMN